MSINSSYPIIAWRRTRSHGIPPSRFPFLSQSSDKFGIFCFDNGRIACAQTLRLFQGHFVSDTTKLRGGLPPLREIFRFRDDNGRLVGENLRRPPNDAGRHREKTWISSRKSPNLDGCFRPHTWSRFPFCLSCILLLIPHAAVTCTAIRKREPEHNSAPTVSIREATLSTCPPGFVEAVPNHSFRVKKNKSLPLCSDGSPFLFPHARASRRKLGILQPSKRKKKNTERRD
jgi:hypothetical protein